MRFRRTRLIAILVVASLASMTLAASMDESGTEWLRKIDAAETVAFSTSTMTQTITTSTGKERSLTFKSFTADSGDVSLMVYTDPPRVTGDKILLRDGGDHIWYYMQRRDVTKHFARHTQNQSMMGSDFSYEDLAQGELELDYTATVLTETELDGEPVVKMELIPTDSGPSYAKVVLWASTQDHLSRQLEYHDEDGHLKTLYLSDFETVDGVKSAHIMRMDNLREGSSTSMQVLEISYAKEPNASLFTKAALSKTIAE